MDKHLVSTSKFLSLVLRHNPAKIGLTLDPQGWADVDELLECAARSGKRIDADTLHRVIRENDKQRFALSEDGLRIRASQGHSIAVDLELPEVEPPPTLYHGTADRFLESILAHGLRPGRRQHVHLSKDIATARTVGGRHGRPVVLRVDAAAMRHAGQVFFCSANGVWLCDAVPSKYLTVDA